MGLSKIEVVTSMNKISSMKRALSKLGVSGMTVVQALGCGVQKGTFEYEAELHEEMELLPKQMIIILVKDTMVDTVVETIKRELYTGHIGDGKIFVSPLTRVIRVRTGEEDDAALE